MDISTLIAQAYVGGDFAQVMMNPLSQFGRPARRYIGAELLPERLVPENMYEEIGIRYRTLIANDGSRYSPAQLKGSDIIGTFDVKLGNSDIATEYTGRDYDSLVTLLQRTYSNQATLSMSAVAQLTDWFDTTVNLALVEKNEVDRWQAIVNASVPRTGDNGYTENVALSNPAGHRVAAGGQWSNDAYDPFADVFAMADLQRSLGYNVSRIITGTDTFFKFAKNAKVRSAATGSRLSVASGTNTLNPSTGRATLSSVGEYLGESNLPPIELYDLTYRTQTGFNWFLPRGAFVMVCTTGRNENIDLGDNEILPMQDTLGYVGVGRPVGSPNPGRSFDMAAKTDKPPRIEAQGWQTSFPVILEPQAIAVISGIS